MEGDRKPRHHDRDHRHQFDENVERRTRRILEGIADRIAHDRGPVAVGTLAAEVPLLDHLLGVVPGAPGIGHEDRQHEAGTQSADQKAHYARHPEDQSDNDRSGDGQQARKQHLTLRTAGRNGDAARVVGRSLAREDALDLAELAAHLLDHALRGAAHGVHRQPAEEERHHRADEDADQHRGVHQRHAVIFHEIENRGVLHEAHRPVGHFEHRHPVVDQADADLLDIGGQQREGRQGRRSDGEALARGGRGVAQRVERVGAFADLGAEAAHLGIAARIVGDRAVGVRGQRDAQRREHAHGRDADAVETHRHVLRSHHVLDVEADGAEVGKDDRHGDRHDGDGRGDHSRADAGDDDRRWACLGAPGDLLRRFIRMGGEVFRGLPDDNARHEARDDRERESDPVLDAQQAEDAERGSGDQQRAEIDAHAQRTEQFAHRGPLLRAHEEDAEDREQDAHRGDQHRGHHGLDLQRLGTGRGEGRSAQRRRGEDRTAVALVKVGAHAGHVAHVVAHVVGDGRGVARVVLRNPRLDLTHQVGTHVGRLGIDTAADAGEERLRRGAHAEGQHRRGDDHELLRPGDLDEMVQNDVPERNVEQAEAHDHQSHHRTAAEGDLQAAVQRLPRGIGRTGRSVGRGLHAEVARKPREKAAGDEGEGNPAVLHPGAISQPGEKQRQRRKDDADDLVLLAQVGHGALAHVRGDLAHARRTLVLALHQAVKRPCEGQGDDGRGRHDPENRRNVHIINYS